MLALLVLGGLLLPAAASAAPPPNDTAFTPGAFQPFTAADGTPRDQQAIGELGEATADGHVPRCLGESSFARTVWYRIPEAPTPQEITVEASGRTLDVVDLAAFVQPPGATGPVTNNPNACDGAGAGGSDAADEPTSAVTLRVPAGRAVLIQVGRRGRVGPPDDERVLLSLDARALPANPPPAGDVADDSTPTAKAKTGTRLLLDDATITEEDPAEPPCPSLGTVWRRIAPQKKPGAKLISVEGRAVSTLAVFSGRRPIAERALDCVVRDQLGPLQMRVPVRRNQPLWVRVGTDRPSRGAAATLRVTDGAGAVVVDGGPGGFDPTTGGPAGGLPAACSKSRVGKARVGGPRIGGTLKARNRSGVFPLTVRVRGSRLCDVLLELTGPRGQVYAQLRTRVLNGRHSVRLNRIRHLVKGVYRLRVTAASELGGYARARSSLKGRLR